MILRACRRAGALGLVLAMVGLLGIASRGADSPAKTSKPAMVAKPATPEPADNSYCLVCHANYEEEKLTKVHHPAGVGCEKCHGESIKHSGDEDGLTPPDKMFAKPQVNAFCLTCHQKDKLVRREEHKEFFKDLQPGETCSDCHGEKHRMAVRTRVWDKRTGKLLKDDGVRMMLKDSPATEGAGRKGK